MKPPISSSDLARRMILVTVPNYLPGFKAGGAIRTIAAMTEKLHRDFHFKILTSDRDLGECAPYPDVPRDVWVRRGNADVRYVSPAAQSFRGLRRALTSVSPDLLYLNGLYHPVYVFRVLLLRRLGIIPEWPVVIAARGHLSPGALSVKKWRKRAYITFLKVFRLLDGVVFQASDELEREEILDVLPSAEVKVAPDVTSKLAPDGQVSDKTVHKRQGHLRVLFLSRISPKKNLLGALRAARRADGEIVFSIVGPVGDEAYWCRCRKLIEDLPGHVNVSYEGPVPHHDVATILGQHHLLFLPTLGENFGHVIRESLEMGRPVLISDQTPWKGIETAGAGWACTASDEDAFVRRIQACIDMDQERFSRHCRAAREYIAEIHSFANAIESNRTLLRNLISRNRSC